MINIQSLIKKAYAGSQLSQEKLAWRYDRGIGVRKSYKHAFYWYEKAAIHGNPIIHYNLGLCYLLGQGTDVDYEKAVYWTRKAAEAEYAEAMLALGWHYHNGFGVEKDYKLATQWYQRSLQRQESGSAYFSLGQLAYDERRFAEAEKYFSAAVNKFNHPKSSYYLGRMYFEGKGIARDLQQARQLLRNASKRHISAAARLLNSKKFILASAQSKKKGGLI